MWGLIIRWASIRELIMGVELDISFSIEINTQKKYQGLWQKAIER